MKEWTREERYRVLYSADEIKDLYDKIGFSKYRQAYHIQPVTGLSSDPNGFVKHKDVWHMFFQWCPWGAVHGLKYWYHVSSPDLIHWKNEGIGLKPDRDYDNRGTHSGSAFSTDGKLYLFYTGNHRDDDWVRTPYTCVATMDDDGRIEKLDAPLFGPRDDYSEHQRDPKVFYRKEDGKYYIFIGAQSLDLKGTILVYKSDELLSGWEFAGTLKVPGYEDFGGMWECPSIEHFGGKDVLIFSPQYTKLPNRGNSTNHNVYFIGKMDYDTLTFTPESDYHFLDYGFDFYAAQCASGTGDPDKGILTAWIGLPDNHYPTEEEDWEGSMILTRELRVNGDRLIQTPAESVYSLREDEIPAGSKLPAACEMDIKVPEGDFDLALFTKEDGSGGVTFRYDAASGVVTVDRRGMDKRFNENVFEVLEMPLVTPLKNLQIFIDHCSFEIFVNDGEETFTSHIYPTDGEHGYTVTDGSEVHLWPLKKSVSTDFIV